MLHNILTNKMIEIKLMMMGFPKLDIYTMTNQEIQILLQLLSHMNRKQQGEET